jgi:hypothetical protein
MLVAILLAGAVGVNVHLPPAATLDLARESGAAWIRIDVDWDQAEPVPGVRRYELYDGLLDAARARGLKVFATVGYTPAWASTGDRLGDGAQNDVPDPMALRSFVLDLAARYSDGRVAAWGTWNEPNLSQFFEGSVDEWLRAVFVPTVDAVRAACPGCLVVGPELASVGDDYDVWLAAALDARGLQLSAVSWHIYAGFPEDDPSLGATRDSFFNKLEARRPQRPLSAREVLLAKGFDFLPLWVTETGAQAAVDDPTALEAQRRHVVRVLDAMTDRRFWQATFIYELSEEHPGGLWPDQHWGLALHVDEASFLRKPAFTELRRRLLGLAQ